MQLISIWISLSFLLTINLCVLENKDPQFWTPLQHSEVRYDFFHFFHFSLLERRPVKEILWSIGYFGLWLVNYWKEDL